MSTIFFLEENPDNIFILLVETLKCSDNDFINSLFAFPNSGLDFNEILISLFSTCKKNEELKLTLTRYFILYTDNKL